MTRGQRGWRGPAALLALSAIPLMAGTARVVELAGGPQLIPSDPRFTASPLPSASPRRWRVIRHRTRYSTAAPRPMISASSSSRWGLSKLPAIGNGLSGCALAHANVAFIR